MLSRLSHRGPDGEGIETDGPLVLGHRRLAVIDPTPAGRQPMADAAGRYLLALNGEIYNYLELREELAARGDRFRTATDTEVLLAALVRWGEEALPRLNGMFAFAFWDRAARTLLAARDRFGEKPFFYRFEPGREFRFASELKALVPPGSGAGRADDAVLRRFLVLGAAGTTAETFFEGIRQLPPAHLLTIRDGRLAMRRWWALPDRPEIVRAPLAESAGRLRDLLVDSVRLRLRSDVPVGTSLSGGIDSSAVVALTARLAGGASRAAFSACFPGTPVDETRYADLVATAAGVEARRVTPTAEGFVADLPRLVASQEEPFGGPSIHAQWKVMELAADAGVTVLLDGQGADEVFAGYPFFFGDLWWSLLRRGRFLRLRREQAAHAAVHGRAASRAIFRGALRSRRPGWVAALRGSPPAPWLAGDFARGRAPFPPRPRDLRESLLQSRDARMLPHLLRHADRNSMAFSREVRLPFLDHRIVEFADALPDPALLSGGATKVVLREALRGVIPEEVRIRTDKIGFAVPSSAWLRGAAGELLADLIASRAFRERGLFDPSYGEAALRRFRSGDDRPEPILWRLLSAELWLGTFCDAGPTAGT
jgi:asparagine synthase (glutamine-hydrolysing)